MPMTPSVSVRIPLEVKIEAVDLVSKRVRVSIKQTGGALKITMLSPGQVTHFLAEIDR